MVSAKRLVSIGTPDASVDSPHVGMNISMGRVRATAGVTIDPLQPVLGAMASCKILQIVGDRDVLGLGGPKEIPSNWVGVVTERNFDGALDSMDISVVAGPLVCLMFLHERDEFFCLPSLHLGIIVVRSTSSSVHHLSFDQRRM